MSANELFINVKELGNLYIYDVLLSYIYPRVFVCRDEYDCMYLFYEMDSANDEDIWLVSKIKKKEYYSLVDRKKSIQKIFEKKNSFEMFSITKEYGDEDIIRLSRNGREWLSHLPKNEVFSEKKLADNIADDTLAVARDSEKTTFDIRLFPGTDRHVVPQNILTKLCETFTSLTGSVYGLKRNEAINVATAPGSCVVRFSFPDQINLLNESNAINEMDILNDIFSSESITDGLEKIKDQKKFIRSYSSFLNTIRKTHSDVQFTTASPNSNSVKIVELTNADIRERFDDVKDIYRIEYEDRITSGKLIALDTKTKKFKFQSEDNSIKTGSVDTRILENGCLEIPRMYEATIRIEKYLNNKGSSNKEKYYLLSLK